MQGSFQKKAKKFCNLTGKWTDIGQPIARMQSPENPDEEITLTLPESCLHAGRCYHENRDCFWAQGDLFSKNNPLADNPS